MDSSHEPSLVHDPKAHPILEVAAFHELFCSEFRVRNWRNSMEINGLKLALTPALAPATVLICKLEFVIFEQVVHEDDELSHAGRQSHQRFFAGGAQAGIKLFEDAIMADGAQGGHVQCTPDGAAAAADMALALEVATVPVIGRDASQGGGGMRVEFSEFGHFGQHGDRHHWADPGDSL